MLVKLFLQAMRMRSAALPDHPCRRCLTLVFLPARAMAANVPRNSSVSSVAPADTHTKAIVLDSHLALRDITI
jgi:hypothetical protein